MGEEPTSDELGLPLPSYPQAMLEMMGNTMTRQKWELKGVEEDLILKNAEVIFYFMMIQKVQMMSGIFLSSVEPLNLNMKDEQNRVEWIRTNSPPHDDPVVAKDTVSHCHRLITDITDITDIVALTNTVSVTKLLCSFLWLSWLQ